MTSAESERSRTATRKSSTTDTAASASSRDVRMSARAFSTCFGWSFPLVLSLRKTPSRRPVRVSNIESSCYRPRTRTKGLPRRVDVSSRRRSRLGEPMVAARNLDLDQVRRLERGLAAVRWFGVAFAFFQVWQSVNAHPTPPEASLPRGYAIAAALALGNLVISLLLRRCRTIEHVRRIGLAAFALDIAVIVGMIWNYSYWAY